MILRYLFKNYKLRLIQK